MRAPETLSTGLQRARPRTGTVSIFKIFPPNQHLHERKRGLPVRGAAESIIAQLDSQGKRTMPRCKNKKIGSKTKF
jgi:hypothetical protein